MFINFWYAAEESHQLVAAPLHRRMLGQDFVLFRDSQGVAHCLSNVCAHRGGSLAHGKLKGDCIECPYHGWQFDGAGQCTKVPSLDADTNIPNRAKVDAYPTVEKYGLVFVFLGDLPEQERPPILTIPEWNQADWRAITDVFEWEINYQRSIENGIDTAHNEFTHTTHIGTSAGENYIPEFDMQNTEWGVELNFTAPGKASAEEGIMREASGKTEDGPTGMRTAQHGVSSMLAYIHPTPEFKIHGYMFETPVDEKNTRLFMIALRNFMLEPEHDAATRKMNKFVAMEDRDVLQRVRPIKTPASPQREILVPSDAPLARYRELLKEWEARGWRIDMDEVRRNQDGIAYAIPSPARRSEKGWVIDAVPLCN
jgi:phenylpropionate dioxygenase-like ring-hydroxylating dioxygenase large terminal subunit